MARLTLALRPLLAVLLHLLQWLRLTTAKAFFDDPACLAVRALRNPSLLCAKATLFRTKSTLLRPELAHLVAELTLTRTRLALQFPQLGL